MPIKSEQQRKFMAMCLHSPEKAKGKCPPKSVANKFIHGHKRKDEMTDLNKNKFDRIILKSLFEGYLDHKYLTLNESTSLTPLEEAFFPKWLTSPVKSFKSGFQRGLISARTPEQQTALNQKRAQRYASMQQAKQAPAQNADDFSEIELHPSHPAAQANSEKDLSVRRLASIRASSKLTPEERAANIAHSHAQLKSQRGMSSVTNNPFAGQTLKSVLKKKGLPDPTAKRTSSSHTGGGVYGSEIQNDYQGPEEDPRRGDGYQKENTRRINTKKLRSLFENIFESNVFDYNKFMLVSNNQFSNKPINIAGSIISPAEHMKYVRALEDHARDFGEGTPQGFKIPQQEIVPGQNSTGRDKPNLAREWQRHFGISEDDFMKHMADMHDYLHDEHARNGRNSTAGAHRAMALQLRGNPIKDTIVPPAGQLD